MTIVIADTSPINYLILIGEIGVLPRLYGRVVIPDAVFAELIDIGAPAAVREWTMQPPDWLEVRIAPSPSASLLDLDFGEASAISLAEFETEVLLLIDESAGRREASRRGIQNIGTLGILRAAAILHLLDLPSALDRLAATNFRVSSALISGLLADHLERKQQGSKLPPRPTTQEQ